MADINSAPQNGPVLSYSVTNDRGWNDPPTFVFSPNTTGNRKRIDPRKRVSHNISSMKNGYNGSPAQTFQPIQQAQPPAPSQPMPSQPSLPPQPVINQQPTAQPSTFPNQQLYNQPLMNNMTNGFQNMTLTPNNTLHHASSNPDLHQMNQMNQQQAPIMHHSASVPAHMNQTGQNRIPGHAFGTMTPPPSSSNTPPLVQPRSGSATPPQAYCHNNQATTNARKMSAPSMPFINNSIFSQHSTPTMLQSSHRKADNHSPTTTPSNGFLPNTNQPTSLPPRVSPMPPTAVPEHLGTNVYARSQSQPEAYRRPSPVSMAPPTTGYYAQKSGGNSPKSISPGNSGHCSPVPMTENDDETLSNTLNTLNNFKCSCQLTNKLSDDISKKLQTFENAWRSGKLSSNTKSKMAQLATALKSNNILMADQIHKRLIHEHSTEVTSWIIGIKKLITISQSNPQ